jgi:hypothetical protein
MSKLGYIANSNLGAKDYFLRHILHDWSDKYYHLILKAIYSTMRPGYSELLIHELSYPTQAQRKYRRDLIWS